MSDIRAKLCLSFFGLPCLGDGFALPVVLWVLCLACCLGAGFCLGFALLGAINGGLLSDRVKNDA